MCVRKEAAIAFSVVEEEGPSVNVVIDGISEPSMMAEKIEELLGSYSFFGTVKREGASIIVSGDIMGLASDKKEALEALEEMAHIYRGRVMQGSPFCRAYSALQAKVSDLASDAEGTIDEDSPWLAVPELAYAVAMELGPGAEDIEKAIAVFHAAFHEGVNCGEDIARIIPEHDVAAFKITTSADFLKKALWVDMSISQVSMLVSHMRAIYCYLSFASKPWASNSKVSSFLGDDAYDIMASLRPYLSTGCSGSTVRPSMKPSSIFVVAEVRDLTDLPVDHAGQSDGPFGYFFTKDEAWSWVTKGWFDSDDHTAPYIVIEEVAPGLDNHYVVSPLSGDVTAIRLNVDWFARNADGSYSPVKEAPAFAKNTFCFTI